MRFSDSINIIVAWLAIVVVFFINTIQSASYNGNNQPYILAQADTMAVFDYDSDWNRTIMTVYKNADVEDYVDENGNITSRPSDVLYDRAIDSVCGIIVSHELKSAIVKNGFGESLMFKKVKLNKGY